MGTGHIPQETDDAAWLRRLAARQPRVAVTREFSARILASFDEASARRNAGIAGAFRRLERRFRETAWPGIPSWKPMVALATSLAFGIVAGAYLPLEEMMGDGGEQTASVAFDAPPAFELGESS